MSQNPFLQKRLSLLRIDEDTKSNIEKFQPLLHAHMGAIIDEFYDFIRKFPEGREIFKDDERVLNLRAKQQEHWTRLFACQFDGSFADSAMAVGKAHYDHRIPPYLYIAGYNFFLCRLITVASENYADSYNLSNLLSSIIKLVNLDIDLALSMYTREHWHRGESDEAVIAVDPGES